MIKSMTGFASVTVEDDRTTVNATLKGVNHRFLDLQVRLPSALAPLESALRGLVQRRVARGRVELTVNLQSRTQPTVEVTVNEPMVAALAAAMARARARGFLTGDLTPSDVLRLPQAIVVREQGVEDAIEATALTALVERAVVQAVDELEAMRLREGTFLGDDLERRRAGLAETIARVAEVADSGRAATETRLGRRIEELRSDSGVDPALIAQEIVRFAARSDISEELVRFRGHLQHWMALTSAEEPCGRKLDFLLQEMNREINTIGSKAEGAGLSELIVHAKAELERMREQIQNVE